MRKSTLSHSLILIISLVSVFVGSFFLRNSPNQRMVPLTDLVPTEHIIQDLSAIALGSRRIAADLAYIQLLQYYGVGFHTHDEEEKEKEAHLPQIEDQFSKLKEFGIRIVRLYPFFNGPILEVAGALAFNEGRFKQALELLREGIDRDPSFFRYHLYVAAILYKDRGNDQLLIQKLDEAIQYPDCPILLYNVLANLHKKYGQFEKALRIYLGILRKANNDFDRSNAQKDIENLLEQHPELRPIISATPF